MGARSIFMTVDGNPTRSQLEKEYYARKSEDREYYGSNPYNGSFSTLGGIDVNGKQFYNSDEAVQYILDHTSKWGDAMAVRVEEDNKQYWLIGGWAAE